MGHRESGDVCKEKEVGVNHHRLRLPVILSVSSLYERPVFVILSVSEESETQALTVILSKAKNLLQEAGMELQILHSA